MFLSLLPAVPVVDDVLRIHFFFLLPPSRVFSLPLLPHSTSLTYYCPCSGTCLLELVVPSLTSAQILVLFLLPSFNTALLS